MADLDYTEYLSLLNGLSGREIIERDLAVSKTVDTHGWRVLCTLWEAKEAQALDRLVRLRSHQAEDFIAETAYVRGLRDAINAYKALAKVAEAKRQEATE